MNTQKIIANIVVVLGFVAVPFIPFIVLGNSTFFPFIVGKNFAFRLIVEIMLASWVILVAIDPAYRPRKSYLLGALVAFLAIITLTALVGENPEKSFWSNFERMEGVITYLHLFAYFIVASTVLSVRNMWRTYLNFHVGVGVAMAVYGVLQWAGMLAVVQDGIRVNGTLGNAAYLGTYALFNIFLALFLMVHTSVTETGARMRMVLYGAVALLQTFVLYHTATRGAMLGLLVGVGVTMILVALFERERLVMRKIAIGALLAILVLVGGFIAFRNTSFVRESPVLARFASISLTEKTTKSRFMVWDMAYQGFKEHPIRGWGMENFNYVFNEYYNPNMYDQEQWFDRAHNVFFDWLIAGGIPALLAYLSLFGCALYCIWRRARALSVLEKSVLTGLLAGYFFQNLFVFDNITSLIYFFTILAFVESMSYESPIVEKKKGAKAEISGGVSEDISYVVSGGALVFALVLIYVVNYAGYKQNTTLLRALSERSATLGTAHNLVLFREALSYDSFGTSEVREQLAQISLSGIERGKELTRTQQEFLVLADRELITQAETLQQDARYQLFTGSFFSRVGMFEQAIVYLEKAHALSPAKQTIMFELGNAYYKNGNTVQAEQIFKQAYELAPAYDEARMFYAQILTANDKDGEAQKILEEGK
jgi:O-antigen ligase